MSVSVFILLMACVLVCLGEQCGSNNKGRAKCSCECDCGGTDPSCDIMGDIWFRTTTGIGKDSVEAWTNGAGATTDKACRNVRKGGCSLHYRDPRIDTWSEQKITEVRYSIYKDEKEVAWVLFNAVDSTMNNWFDKSRVILSSYTDLTSSAQYNFFAINDPSHILHLVTRHWYVANSFAGCQHDDFWFVTTDATGNCYYDKLDDYPYILYSAKPTMANSGIREDFRLGDVAVVTVRRAVSVN